jgi:periplasmic protein TonB
MQTHIAPKPAIIAGVLEAGLLYALIAGLGFSVPGSQMVQDTLKTFDIVPPAPTPPPPPPPSVVKSGRPEGAAAPAGLRAKASPIVAPPPPIPIPPPPIAAAPVAGQGTQSRQGATDMDAGGFGAGGVGNGFGSGGRGFGDGGGGGRPPRQRRGSLSYQDVPEGILDPGEGLNLETRYHVNLDGSVSDCRVTRSSGHRDLDERICRLIEQRFRFDPARDEDGQRVESDYIQWQRFSARGHYDDEDGR